MVRYDITNGGKKKSYTAPEQLKGKRLVSVILPTFNEEGNIVRLCDRLSSALKKYDYEIVVVDDNSKDRTPQLMDKLAKSARIVAIHRFDKRGIFSAIRDGAIFARGEFIVIMDADFSHPPEKVAEMLQHKNFDMVSGSRFMRGGGVEAPANRKFTTVLLNLVIRIIMLMPYHDLTGGFHLINKEKFQKMRFKYQATWGEFDLELFFLAHRQRWRIKEIPFIYKFREEGESKSADTPFKFVMYGVHYFLRAVNLRLFR